MGTLVPGIAPILGPSEFDQMSVFISDDELERPKSSLADVRELVSALPFEGAVLKLALLNASLEPVSRSPEGQWAVAQRLFSGRLDLIGRYAQILGEQPHRVVFSPQPLALLMRLLIEHAADSPVRELTDTERRTFQDAVLGVHSAFEPAIDMQPRPSSEDLLAYELQTATFFRHLRPLEEMTRHRELLRLATVDDRLSGSTNHVPVDSWLAASGLSAEQQWAVGFGMFALTSASGTIHPRVSRRRIDGMLTALKLGGVSGDLPMISASRSDLRDAFAQLGGRDGAMAWELRPFKTTPFLRFGRDELLLLSSPWLLSWVSEGFHYRALSHAQQAEGSTQSERYTRFIGEVFERYALDLAEVAATRQPVEVFGEQPYGTTHSRTSDVAIVSGSDLVLFEIHARRVPASASITGDVEEATREIFQLLGRKVNQIGVCIAALLSGEATLPGVEIGSIKRIWPVVVTAGWVFQTPRLWEYLRASADPQKTASLADPRAGPLQVLAIDDYEMLMGLLEAGEDLPGILKRKTMGPFRERDFGPWLSDDPHAPSSDVRLSILNTRWEEMSGRLLQLAGPGRR